MRTSNTDLNLNIHAFAQALFDNNLLFDLIHQGLEGDYLNVHFFFRHEPVEPFSQEMLPPASSVQMVVGPLTVILEADCERIRVGPSSPAAFR